MWLPYTVVSITGIFGAVALWSVDNGNDGYGLALAVVGILAIMKAAKA